MIFCMVAGAVLLAAVVGMGYLKFDTGMPVAGSCSIAIAAACHVENSDQTPRDLLKWGEVHSGGNETDVGHCAFTNGLVRKPTVSRLYAGQGCCS